MIIMDRGMTDSLAHFCAVQRNNFEAEDWLALDGIYRDALGLAAKYLSMTSWYGHAEELEEIARRNHFSDRSTGLHRESQALRFDLPYFSAKVRLDVARCQPDTPGHADNSTESAAGDAKNARNAH